MTSSHQQDIVDAGLDVRPLMLEKGIYVPWASRFMRFTDGKNDQRESIKKGRYVMKEIPDLTSPPNAPLMKYQTKKYLSKEERKRYYTNIDAMNLILQGIPNNIYNSVDACQDAKAIWNRVKRLMQGTKLSKRERDSRLINEFDKFSVEPAITQHFLTATNNHLHTSSNTRNQVVIQDSRVDIQSKNVGYTGNGSKNSERITGNQGNNDRNVQCYNCKEIGHYAGECLKPRIYDSKYFREQMQLSIKDEVEIHLDEEAKDFMLMNASRDEQLENSMPQ
ncbi:integrase, catalytic region, zinc finger, CCHC-type containing protein [Tanacetum coccineum]